MEEEQSRVGSAPNEEKSRYAGALLGHLNDSNLWLAYLTEVLLADTPSEYVDCVRNVYAVNWHLARAVEKGKLIAHDAFRFFRVRFLPFLTAPLF